MMCASASASASVVVESSYKSGHESKSLMREAIHIDYSFIPADDKHLKIPGFCVPDQIDAIYGKLITTI